jgi:AcrR family transcriptional regulator
MAISVQNGSGPNVQESISVVDMARPKQFDRQKALEAAIEVFRTHGYAGASAELLTSGMKIGRQSLYNTFGDKWQLYIAAVDHYSATERDAHLVALHSGQRAFDGVIEMIERVVEEASAACLGVASINEFGCMNDELNAVRGASAMALRQALSARLSAAKLEGDLSPEFDIATITSFLLASIAGIRLAAHGGADGSHIRHLADSVIDAIS